MKLALPYFLFAVGIHSAYIILLICSPGTVKRQKFQPFQEKIVCLPETRMSAPLQKSSSPSIQSPKSPSPQKPPEVPAITPPALSQPPQPKSSQHPQVKKESQKVTKPALAQQTKLKAIADLTKKLSEHLEDSSTHWDPLPKHHASPSLTSSSAETQEEELCQLLREYIVLPMSGEVRLKLILTPQGKVYECTVLSKISEAEQQFILTRIREIPFTKFLDKYKISKNIVFHIKLLSNES